MEILFFNFYSFSLDNARNLTVYRPYSLIENPISRVVNVMVVFDGDIDTITLLSRNGGIDGMISTGQMPESIIVGKPRLRNTASMILLIHILKVYQRLLMALRVLPAHYLVPSAFSS